VGGDGYARERPERVCLVERLRRVYERVHEMKRALQVGREPPQPVTSGAGKGGGGELGCENSTAIAALLNLMMILHRANTVRGSEMAVDFSEAM
jgi:hypothetical protein